VPERSFSTVIEALAHPEFVVESRVARYKKGRRHRVLEAEQYL